MNRILILLIVFSLIIPAMIMADEFEVGVAVTPLSIIKDESAIAMENMYGSGGGFFQDNILGLHVGYSLAWLFYASLDANIMPAWWIKNATEFSDEAGELHQGIFAPGIISFLDIGIRPTFGPVILMAELGINYLYIHSYYNVDPQTGAELAGGKMGFNFRVGVGYEFEPFSISLLGTSVYSSFDVMKEALAGVAKGNKMAIEKLSESLIPSLAFYIHL